VKDFRSLQVWENAHELALGVYRASSSFPSHELYGLTAQLRRSAASVPTNIAEGCGRGSDADLARFLQIAMGSACEMEYQLLLAHDLGYLTQERYSELTSMTLTVKRMLTRFLQRLHRQ